MWRRGVVANKLEARAEMLAGVHARRVTRWRARMALKVWRVLTRGQTFRLYVEQAEDDRAVARRAAVLARR
jgi:hypothetical protein